MTGDAAARKPRRTKAEVLAAARARKAKAAPSARQGGGGSGESELPDNVRPIGHHEGASTDGGTKTLDVEPVEKSNAATRPKLDVSSGPALIDQMLDQLGAGPTSGTYLRGGRPVRILSMGEGGYTEPTHHGDSDGPAQVHVIDGKALRAILQLRYVTYKPGEKGPVRMSPNVTACEDVVQLAVQGECRSLPILRGVTHVPIVRPDGSVLDQAGYDNATRLLYLPNGLNVPTVSAEPTRRQVSDAVQTLLYMVGDFPFVSEPDRANYLGLLLTPLLRLLAPGPWPLGAINAHMAGSGKTLLAKIPEALYGTVVRSEPADSDEEIRKSITSILLNTTAPVIVFDNVKRVLDSPVLEKLLTDAAWSDRVLGTSRETPKLANDRLWLVTGNNVAVGGDMSRRTLWVSVDPRDPNPWLRTGFAESDLLGYVTTHRGPIIAALLTLVRAWVAAGSPSGGLARTDDYREWSATVGGILAHAEVPGQFWSPETDRAPVGQGDDDWGSFLAAVHDEFGDEPMTAREVLDKASRVSGTLNTMDAAARLREALPGNLAEKLDRNGPAGTSKSLGRWFGNMDGRYAGEYVARLAGDDGHKTKRWTVTKQKP